MRPTLGPVGQLNLYEANPVATGSTLWARVGLSGAGQDIFWFFGTFFAFCKPQTKYGYAKEEIIYYSAYNS